MEGSERTQVKRGPMIEPGLKASSGSYSVSGVRGQSSGVKVQGLRSKVMKIIRIMIDVKICGEGSGRD